MSVVVGSAAGVVSSFCASIVKVRKESKDGWEGDDFGGVERWAIGRGGGGKLVGRPL